jgi:hypothetical protein
MDVSIQYLYHHRGLAIAHSVRAAPDRKQWESPSQLWWQRYDDYSSRDTRIKYSRMTREDLIDRLTQHKTPWHPVAIEVGELTSDTLWTIYEYWTIGQKGSFVCRIKDVANMAGTDPIKMEMEICAKARLIFVCAHCGQKTRVNRRSHFEYLIDPKTRESLLCYPCRLGLNLNHRITMSVFGGDKEVERYYRKLVEKFQIVIPNSPIDTFVDREYICQLWNKQNLSKKENQEFLSDYFQHRLQFVVCDFEGNPLFAAECTGRNPTGKNREMKKLILEAVGIPMFLLPEDSDRLFATPRNGDNPDFGFAPTTSPDSSHTNSKSSPPSAGGDFFPF